MFSFDSIFFLDSNHWDLKEIKKTLFYRMINNSDESNGNRMEKSIDEVSNYYSGYNEPTLEGKILFIFDLR